MLVCQVEESGGQEQYYSFLYPQWLGYYVALGGCTMNYYLFKPVFLNLDCTSESEGFKNIEVWYGLRTGIFKKLAMISKLRPKLNSIPLDLNQSIKQASSIFSNISKLKFQLCIS